VVPHLGTVYIVILSLSTQFDLILAGGNPYNSLPSTFSFSNLEMGELLPFLTDLLLLFSWKLKDTLDAHDFDSGFCDPHFTRNVGKLFGKPCIRSKY
jgi:hypothetical protein